MQRRLGRVALELEAAAAEVEKEYFVVRQAELAAVDANVSIETLARAVKCLEESI